MGTGLVEQVSFKSSKTMVMLTLWRLAVFKRKNGLLRLDGPSPESFLMMLGRHCHKPSSGQVKNEIRGSRQVLLSSGKEQPGCDWPFVSRRLRSMEKDSSFDCDRRNMRKESNLIECQLIGGVIVIGGAYVRVCGFFPGCTHHLDCWNCAKFSQLDHEGFERMSSFYDVMRRTFSSPSFAYIM